MEREETPENPWSSSWADLLGDSSKPSRKARPTSQITDQTVVQTRSEPRLSDSTESSSSFITNPPPEPPLSPKSAAAAAKEFLFNYGRYPRNTTLPRTTSTFNLDQLKDMAGNGDISGLSGSTQYSASHEGGEIYADLPGQDARRWLTRTKNRLKRKGITDVEELLEEFDSHLGGAPASWCRKAVKVQAILKKEDPQEEDWESVQKAFLARWDHDTEPDADPLTEATNLKQETMEDLREYYDRATNLLGQLEIEDGDNGTNRQAAVLLDLIARRFAAGLHDEDLKPRVITAMRARVTAGQVRTLRATYEKAKEEEQTIKEDLEIKKQKHEREELQVWRDFASKMDLGEPISKEFADRVEKITGKNIGALLRPGPIRAQSEPSQGPPFASRPITPRAPAPPAYRQQGPQPQPGPSRPPNRPVTPESVQMNPWQMSKDSLRKTHPAWEPSHSQNRIISGEIEYVYRGPGTDLCHKCGATGHRGDGCNEYPLGTAEQTFLRNLTQFQVQKSAAIRQARAEQDNRVQTEARFVQVGSEDDYSTGIMGEKPRWETVPKHLVAMANAIETGVYNGETEPANKRARTEDDGDEVPAENDKRCATHQKVEKPAADCVSGKCGHACCQAGARQIKAVKKSKTPRQKKPLAKITAEMGEPAINILDLLKGSNIVLPFTKMAQLSPQFRDEVKRLLTVPRKTRTKKGKQTVQVDQITAALSGRTSETAVGARSVCTDILSQIEKFSKQDRTVRAFSLPAKVWKEGSKKMLKLPRNLVIADQGSDINIIYRSLVDALKLRQIPIRELRIPPIRMTVADGSTVDLKRFAILHVLVEGIVRKVWALICPSESSNDSKAVALLLGVPYLDEVRAQIQVHSRAVEIGDTERGEKRVLVPAAGREPVKPKIRTILEDIASSAGEDTSEEDDESSDEETAGPSKPARKEMRSSHDERQEDDESTGEEDEGEEDEDQDEDEDEEESSGEDF